MSRAPLYVLAGSNVLRWKSESQIVAVRYSIMLFYILPFAFFTKMPCCGEMKVLVQSFGHYSTVDQQSSTVRIPIYFAVERHDNNCVQCLL